MKPQVATVELQLRQPQFSDALQELPSPIIFRFEDVPPHSTYPALSHPWGEFIYSFGGITEVMVNNNKLFASPNSGLWIPPETEHICFNRRETAHGSLYISNDLGAAMPDTACVLLVSPLARAVLEHLQGTSLSGSQSPESERLLHVLVDQLATCETTESFMPYTDDPRLGPLLQALHDDPADNRTLQELATAFHMSKRTLMRRCETELGMSLTEWRQRLRLVNALPLIKSGHSVESVALSLGYATSSAFIVMFRRLMGSSPKEFTSKR